MPNAEAGQVAESGEFIGGARSIFSVLGKLRRIVEKILRGKFKVLIFRGLGRVNEE